ncbi:ABC transporter ATP-binding protein [bacterium]|nr:ABC transporter ATP-binding protein [candidate division CSSED10-310 bacterium]
MNPVVECTDVSVRFRRYQERNRMIRWTLIDLAGQRRQKEFFWALKDVSFNIKSGETFGIIGENGSGKSTILKLLSGIILPDEGTVSIQGRISALLELGAGFQPDLTARENIYLNGSIMGLTRAQINTRFDNIVRFSELDKFLDTPIKYFSSGMYMRLGFSIAVHVEPDILLIDEVLAVGDQSFQHKCIDKIRDFKRHGKTIIFVSHDLATVKQLCSRAVWLNNGRIDSRGTADKVIEQYRESIQDHDAGVLAEDYRSIETEMEKRWGGREIEITRVEFFDRSGQSTHQFRTGDMFRIKISFNARHRVSKPVFGIAIHRNDGVHINGPNTKFSGEVTEYINGSGAIWYETDFLPLLPGTYNLTAVVYNYSCDHPYDHHDQMFPFRVLPGCTDEEYGVCFIPGRWKYEGDHGKITS